MGIYKEARTPTSRGKKLDHLEIYSKQDGVTIRHVYQEDGLNLHKPRDYDFGLDEVDDLVQHLGKHAGLPVHAQVSEVAEEGGE